MAADNKKQPYRMLCLIAAPKLAKKAADLFKQGNVSIQYLFHAQGTASSEVMDMLGLDGVEKNILMSMMPKAFANEMLTKLQKKLHLGMPNTGVAFTAAMSSGSGRIIQLMDGLRPELNPMLLERTEIMDNKYSMIMAIVNQGFSEDVMDAARPMGASGGTVFHSRMVGNAEGMNFWKINVQQEREVVLILAREEDKLSIMKAVGEKCGMQSEAQGIAFSVPVDKVAGLD